MRYSWGRSSAHMPTLAAVPKEGRTSKNQALHPDDARQPVLGSGTQRRKSLEHRKKLTPLEGSQEMQHDELDTAAYGRIIDNLYDGLYFVDRTGSYNTGTEPRKGSRVIRQRKWSAGPVRITFSPMSTIMAPIFARGSALWPQRLRTDRCAKRSSFMHHKDGHRVPVSIRVGALTDADGRVIGGVELFTDISSLKSIDSTDQRAGRNGPTRQADRAGKSSLY